MNNNKNTPAPGLLQMIRAPFLSSILSPILAGSALAFYLSGDFNWYGFALVLIMGLCLHSATNVYNDIYDTKQGTDSFNVHRNEFSGGSGILQNHPHVLSRMYRIARTSLVLALIVTVLLMRVVEEHLWSHLWVLYLLSAFFSKYYTAAPVKLAYRGLGEVSVWFAFGPMAISIAAVSQSVDLGSVVVAAMPATGLSTLSILLIGQLIDLKADSTAGKRGIAARLGTRVTAWFYFLVQSLLVLDIVLLGLVFIQNGWFILLALVPYILLFPGAWSIVRKHHDNPDKLKPAAGTNVMIHLLFSLLFLAGLILTILVG